MNSQIKKETTDTHSDWQSLKRLWNLAGPLKHKIVRGIIFRFLQSFSLGLGYGVAIIVVTTLVTSQKNATIDWFYQICFLSLLSLAGQLIFSFLSSHQTWMASFQLSSDLRIKMLRRMNQLPLGFHLSRHRGDAVTVLTTDMQTVETFLSDGLPRIAEAFGLPIAVLTYLIFQNTTLFAAAAVSIVLSIPVYLIASHKLAQLGIKRQDTQASAAARMIEYIQGLVVIKSFNRLAKGQEDFENALDVFRNLSNKMVKQLVFPLVIFGAVTLLGIPVIFYVDSHLLLSDSISLSLFITTLMLIYALYSPLLGLVAVLEQTRMADASLTRMNRILNAETLSEPEKSENPTTFDIQFGNVRFGYSNEKQDVIKNINFCAKQNTVTAIVGPSGAGKSTLLNLIARFWDVTSGEITIGGINLQHMKTKDLNKLVTFVFQNVYLFSGTVMDNLRIGKPHATEDEIIYATKMAQAYDFIMNLPDGFNTQIGEGGATLSGGERQRLSIARAILKDTPIILMDEATAAIDPTNERAFYQALQALTANKTVLIVAHKLSTIKNSDQIIVMDDGKIVQQGSHCELVSCNGLYKNLWGKWSGAASWKFNPSKTNQENSLRQTGIGNEVSQTLFIPLYMKAQQTLAKDSFFQDLTAVHIIENMEHDFSVFNQSVASSVGCAVRADYMDSQVIDFIDSHEKPVVVNIGCGLDARYERVRPFINKKTHFYNLDLPEVIKMRDKLLPGNNESINLTGSIFKTSWMETLTSFHPDAQFFFTIEGVLMYFDKSQVKNILKNLTLYFKGGKLVFDATSGWMAKHSHRHDSIKHTGTEFQLYLDNPHELEVWNSNIKVTSVHYYCDFKEFRRIGYMKYFLMKYYTPMRKAAYIVTCDISQ